MKRDILIRQLLIRKLPLGDEVIEVENISDFYHIDHPLTYSIGSEIEGTREQKINRFKRCYGTDNVRVRSEG